MLRGASACASGFVSGDCDEAFAALAFNLDEATGTTMPMEITPTVKGVRVTVDDRTGGVIRLQIAETGDSPMFWCVELQGNGEPEEIEWSDFNTECWEESSGSDYAGEPIASLAVTVSYANCARAPEESAKFDFCWLDVEWMP